LPRRRPRRSGGGARPRRRRGRPDGRAPPGPRRPVAGRPPRRGRHGPGGGVLHGPPGRPLHRPLRALAGPHRLTQTERPRGAGGEVATGSCSVVSHPVTGPVGLYRPGGGPPRIGGAARVRPSRLPDAARRPTVDSVAGASDPRP